MASVQPLPNAPAEMAPLLAEAAVHSRAPHASLAAVRDLQPPG